jgi:phosphate:Na+ symporter
MDSLALIGGVAGGIGLFLLGMGLMTDGLKLAAGPALERILAGSTKTRLRGLASGILVTALVQSSSAMTVATIGFVNAGLLNLSQALWVLFGANVGATVTALIAAIGATPNAKRAAAAHILFNLLTGIVALLLPWLIGFLAVMREWLGLDEAPAAKLALFHTAFNVLGVVLIWPVAARMTTFLEARFKSAEEDEGRPRYLDRTVLAVPALALDALERELRRLGGIALATVHDAFEAAPSASCSRCASRRPRVSVSFSSAFRHQR